MATFGIGMHNREFSSEKYKFGFSGKEKDNELTNVEGGHYNFGFRIYDSRLGRWLSIDPDYDQFPFESAYSYVSNCVIEFIDAKGRWKGKLVEVEGKQKVVFVAETGDDLKTLEIQMGLKEGTLTNNTNISTAYTNKVNGANNTVEGVELSDELMEIPDYKSINDAVNNSNINQMNCANFAGIANGEEGLNNQYDPTGQDQYPYGTPGAPTDELGTRLENGYTNVSDANASTGDVLSYKYDYNNAKDLIISTLQQQYPGITEKEIIDGYGGQEGFDQVVKQNMTYPTHYAIVLLKSKDGTKIDQVIEKNGDTPVKIDSPSEHGYDRKPVSGDQGNSVYKKKE